MGFPSFSAGEVLTAADMNAVGLWLVKTQTIGAGVSSVVVSNAFSATYDNYLITVSGGTGTASAEFRFRLGAATSGYRYSFLYTTYNNTPAAVGTAAGSFIEYVGQATTSSLGAYITLQNPFLTEHTFVQGPCGTETFAGFTSGYLANTTSYSEFTLIIPVGTITGGTIRVYGYRN
jgi:hypothetical protein